MAKRITATTLIEAILYMGLLSALLMSVGGFVREIFTARNRQQSVIEVENEAMSVLGQIERDLKLATSVTVPVAGASGNTLTLYVNGAPAVTHSYTLSGTTLTHATAAITSNRVTFSNFVVSHRSTVATYHIVTVSFTAAYTNPGGRQDLNYQKTYSTSVILRPNP